MINLTKMVFANLDMYTGDDGNLVVHYTKQEAGWREINGLEQMQEVAMEHRVAVGSRFRHSRGSENEWASGCVVKGIRILGEGTLLSHSSSNLPD